LIRVAVIGYGYWGPNLARNFHEAPGAELAAIVDLNEKALATASVRYPSAKCTSQLEEVLSDPRIDAVAIATPVASHTSLALQAFSAGKHVLVEKPIAASVADAKKVVAAAEQAGKVLLVDHTFVYMGAVRKVKDLIDRGELGDLYYFDSVRVNLGLFQHDVSVLWDLAVHDLSIVGAWIPQRPKSVSCISVGHVAESPDDVAYLTLLYENNLVAHVHVNWLSPVKIRRMLLGGSDKMVVFDDLDPVEKIKIYDRGITRKEDLVGTGQIPLAYRRTGDVLMPQFDMTEALRVEVDHFVRCIEHGEKPLTGGAEALQIIEILEAAEQSNREQGRMVTLP
jgi:predicted dehydrogenase